MVYEHWQKDVRISATIPNIRPEINLLYAELGFHTYKSLYVCFYVSINVKAINVYEYNSGFYQRRIPNVTNRWAWKNVDGLQNCSAYTSTQTLVYKIKYS